MPSATPEFIYATVFADNGVTPANELATQFGLKNHGQIMQAIGKYILSEFNKTGEMLPYPKMNVTIQETRKVRSTSNHVNRQGPDSPVSIKTSKLKELGNFDQISTFEVSVSNGALVLTPLARFAPSAYQMVAELSDQPKKRGRRPKNEQLETIPITGNGLSAAVSTSVNASSATPTEVAAAVPVAPAIAPDTSNDNESDFEDEEELELNANMV